MILPTALTSINQAAVAAARAGRHEEALQLYAQLFQQLQERHLSHPQLFVTHSNKAASHLALGQHAAALQDAKACLELLTLASASQGLLGPSRHPHWPKACQRLGQAFVGLHQHQQAASAFEAGLAADPLNPALKAGLQQAQQGLAADLLSGRTLTHVKALPAPATPERITLAPHNSTKGVRGSQADSSSGRVQRRGHAVGWQADDDTAALLLSAAESVQHAVQAAEASGEGTAVSSCASGSVSAAGVFAAGSSQLPKLLLTPAAAAADVGLRDVYEYLATQSAIRAPKQYLYRILPDSRRIAAWWDATTAAVQAVQDSGRTPRVLLLGAKAGVLAVAALRAGAAHVTCVESSPYLAAACSQVLADNGFPAASHTTICTPSLSSLRIGPTPGTDMPNICNCLVADLLDDGVLSGGLIPAVANALEELLVREGPVLVPQHVTVSAQAVGVKPSVVEVEGIWQGGGSSGSGSGGCDGSSGSSGGTVRLDLTALDAYRWTPSQALPSPLDPDTFTPLSAPKPVWHIPLADVAADRSAVQHLDFELTASGTWCAVAFWAELQLYGDITLSTAGPWNSEAAAGSKPSHSPSSEAAGASSCSRSQHSQPADAPQPIILHASATGPAAPLLLTYPSWDSPDHSSVRPAATSGGASTTPRAAAATGPATGPASPTTPRPVFQAPPSQQPAVCWLPGGLPVSAGDIFPVVASHNTVRCLFTLQEADYSFLFHQEPSFPHGHFSMVSDTQRLQAYAAALRTALARAAAHKQEQQLSRSDTAAAHAPSAVPGSVSAAQEQLAGGGSSPQRLDLTVLDVGCGSGVLSLLAAAALSSPPNHNPCTAAPSAKAAMKHLPPVGSADAIAPTETASAVAPDTAPVQHNVSVVGVELTAPLAAAAQRVVAANWAAGAVSIVQADAGSCRSGQQVPPGGADVVVLDLFDAGFAGHGVLGLVELAKASLAAEGAQIVPASATLYCMGLELLTVNSWGCHAMSVGDSEDGVQRPQEQQQQQQTLVQGDTGRVNLRALDAYRWSDEPDTVLLHHLPHKPLTAPVKLGDFDFCAPAGTPYPKEMQARLEAVASGRMDVLVLWFDLHLAEGVSITSAPDGFTTGGRTSSSPHHPHKQHHWGQALHYLDSVLSVLPGDEVQLGALREGPKLSFAVLDATRPNSSSRSSGVSASRADTVPADSASSSHGKSYTPGAAAGAAAGNAHQQQEGAGSAALLPQLHPAPRPPWLRPGAGIEDPAVWSVKKCQQLLGQMLLRATGAKFPPIWKDLQLMQVHTGSLGLCAATVGAVTQELTMREALAVASQKQLMVSPFALPDAAGTQPPVVWR